VLDGALSVTGTGTFGRALATLPDGTFLVTGQFASMVTFGEGEANETVLTNAGIDRFVARYLEDGSLLWALGVAVGTDVRSEEIVAHADGSFVLGGFFVGTATIGTADGTQRLLTSAGGQDIWLAQFNASGDS
jgi:hypothetical protein